MSRRPQPTQPGSSSTSERSRRCAASGSPPSRHEPGISRLAPAVDDVTVTKSNLPRPEGDTLPVTPARIARALVGVLGGYEAGWGLWLAALGQLEQALLSARENRDRFCSWPPQELRRLHTALEDALRLATTAVEIQLAVNEEPEGAPPSTRLETIADVLQERAVDLARRRAAL